jgi:hypothetical protein
MHFFKQTIRFWKTWLVLFVILTLCLIPSSDLNKIDLLKLNYEDLAVHLVMFITFSSILYNDFKRNSSLSQRPLALSLSVLLLSILLGIITEMLQYILISLNRTASFTDFIFDFAGAALGITYMRFIKR